MADDTDDTTDQRALSGAAADPALRFQPGQSGNHGGRPKGARRIAKDAADGREYAARDGKTYRGGEAMMHVLIDIATDPAAKDRDRRESANCVLDRLWGKPAQRVDVAEAPVATIDFDSMTDEEIDAEIARLEREEAEERRQAPNTDVARRED